MAAAAVQTAQHYWGGRKCGRRREDSCWSRPTVLPVAGPKRVNVSVPPAAVRVAGLGADVSITAAVGLGAVPVREALWVIGLPRDTSAPAVVVRVFVTGVTTKHSPMLTSLDGPMPALF
jgi:hypothetical protein